MRQTPRRLAGARPRHRRRPGARDRHAREPRRRPPTGRGDRPRLPGEPRGLAARAGREPTRPYLSTEDVMTTATAARVPDRASTQREGLRCRIRLADGRVFAGRARAGTPPGAAARDAARAHRRLGRARRRGRRDGRLHITTRRRADHFLPGGAAGRGGWLEELLELAGAHADAGGGVRRPGRPVRSRAARSRRSARPASCGSTSTARASCTALWAFLAERPCHLLSRAAGRAAARLLEARPSRSRRRA